MKGRHETSDLKPLYVAYFAIGLVISAVVVHVAVWFLFVSFAEREERKDFKPTLVETQPAAPPEPRLQISPQSDYRELQRHEMDILKRYEWIDRKKRIARIPIERAMEMMVEKSKQ